MSAAPTSTGRPRGGMWGPAVCVIFALTIVAALAVGGLGAAQAQASSTAPVAPASDAPVPDVAEPEASLSAAAELTMGTVESFWALDWGASSYSRIEATVRYVGTHAVVYLHNGAWFSDFLISELGSAFDNAIYPALTSAYGSEPNPGLDGDPRVSILVYDFHSAVVDGSFNPYDIQPQGFSRSNNREMFCLNLQALLAEPESGGSLAAHEFAHLITYYRDVMLDPSPSPAFEPSWLAEGFSTYAEHLAGYDGRTNSQLVSFSNDPAFSLTYWQGVRANYGASYSFMRYLAQREGAGFIRALVDQPLDGVAGIDATLAAAGSVDRFATLFDEWIVAGFLDGCSPQVSPYCFDNLAVSARPVTLAGAEPLLGIAGIPNFGAVYLDFPATSLEATFQAVIDGSARAPLEAALISWDSAGVTPPAVMRFDLANAATAGTVTAPAGYDRHTLAVWARGSVGSAFTYEFRYSGAADPPGGVQFLDMGGSDPFYPYVATLLARGVISGREVPSGSGVWFFGGTEDVLRAQFAKIIVEATGLHTEEVDNLEDPSFNDVFPVYKNGALQAYPYDYVEEAAALGIVSGYSTGAFDPYNPITRGQLVLMITRGAAAAGRPLPAYTGHAKVFADVPVSHPYYRAVMAAYSAGILSGSRGSDGRLYFYPYSSASRNHVAKMTARLVEYLEEPIQ